MIQIPVYILDTNTRYSWYKYVPVYIHTKGVDNTQPKVVEPGTLLGLGGILLGIADPPKNIIMGILDQL